MSCKSGNLYRVQATVEKGKIVAADCSCLVGDGRHCKHIAALLLTWLNRPDDLREVEETNKEETKAMRAFKEEMGVAYDSSTQTHQAHGPSRDPKASIRHA